MAEIERVEPKLAELEGADRRLVAAALAGPLAWLAQLVAGISLAEAMCAAQARWPLHLVSVLAFGVTLLGVAVCLRPARGDGAGAPSKLQGRTRRAIGWAGVGIGAFFAVLIAGSALPGLVLDPCWR